MVPREICNGPFKKGRHIGLTALRKALVACPKTVGAVLLRAFESSFMLHVIAVSFPYCEALAGTCPKPYDLRLSDRPTGTDSIQACYSIEIGLWAAKGRT